MKFWTPSLSTAGLLLAIPLASYALDYFPDAADGSIVLTDDATGISGIKTIFLDDVINVELDGIAWILDDSENATSTSILAWETAVDGEIEASGTVDLTGIDALDLPSSIGAGSVVVSKGRSSSVTVTISMDAISTGASGDFQTYARGVSIIPLITILAMCMSTKMVELSLFLGIWLGGWIITGSLSGGFQSTLDNFILNALYNDGHVYVILFTVFLAGVVGMMQKSGGMLGFTNTVSKLANKPRVGQFCCMFVGLIIFFDDYANILMTGETMRPLLDVLMVSREKLAFIVDATAAPVASVVPLSSWAGFEASLVQEAIDEIIKKNGAESLTISSSGFAVFLQSVRYSYYSLFMLGLMAMLIATQRDYGPMLIAERKVRVYERTDGGDGAAGGGGVEGKEQNQPREDQPLLMHNMLVPVLVMIILVLVIIVNTGTTPGADQSFQERVESGDPFSALLWGSMATALISLLFYLVQITIPGTGKLALPTPAVLADMLPWRKKAVLERGDQPPRFLMSVHESVEGFLFGMTRVFLCICILTLAWASGDMMKTVGADRLFAAWITGGAIPYQILPLLTFLVALLMGLATGTSWGTMSILFPLILVPTYDASAGDPQVFYATVSAVLGGAVAGDHMSPISDTTVLSALACDVNLMDHVNTQAPYVLWVVLFAGLFGYIPTGYGAPNIVGILLGWVACALFVFFVCVPVMPATGRWDFMTQLCCARSSELRQLADDCVKKVAGETPEGKEPEGTEVMEEKGAGRFVVENLLHEEAVKVDAASIEESA